MDEKFNPEKYGMTFCLECEGYGRISYSDGAQVCKYCGGFGLVRKEGKTFDQIDDRISATTSWDNRMPENRK